MALPNAHRAIIDRSKLSGYVLSSSHPIGRFKARFFYGLGYDPEDPDRLSDDLRFQHLVREAVERSTSKYGTRFEIRGPLTGPNGRRAEVVSVWFVRSEEDFPRFVTAYPGEK